MSITCPQAIEAARLFASKNASCAWDDTSVEVQVDIIEGRSTWIVSAKEALDPDQPAWTQIDWKPTSYFVDAESGRILGFANERARTMFG